MRKALVLLLLGTLAGCGGGDSQQAQNQSQDLKTYDASADASAETAAPGAPPPPPDVAPTAAPGVAFNYRYAFRLAGGRIGAVQEQHAAACEKLGIARCRITAMRYRLVGAEDIEAMLAFKVDPAIARTFGKQGIDAVTRAEGMLVDAEITGEDVGSRIAAATRSVAELESELADVEAQLRRAGLRSPERAELQLRAQQLRDQIRSLRSTRTEQQESLATTPMVFNYGTGDLVPGFDGRPRIGRAWERAVDNFMGGLAWILVLLITLLPWVVLAAALYALWRRVLAPLVRRIGTVTPPPPAPEA